MDAFVRLVSEAREAGRTREALSARVKATWSPIPRDTGERVYVAHKAVQGYLSPTWDGASYVAPVTNPGRKLRAWSRRKTAYVTRRQVWKLRRAGHVSNRVHGRRMDQWSRYLIPAYVDTVTREALPADRREGAAHRKDGQYLAREAARAKRGTRAPWVTEARDPRVNDRGKHGDRKVKVGSHAARVSVRDNYLPALMLAPMGTCGVATHPDASDANYVELVEYVRRHPEAASLTRYMPGPHGRIRSVLPVSAYVTERAERREAKRARVNRETVAIVPEVLRLAGTVGYVGNIE